MLLPSTVLSSQEAIVAWTAPPVPFPVGEGNVLVQPRCGFSLGTPNGVLQSSQLKLLLHRGGLASPDPTQSSTAEAVSSTGCSRRRNVPRRRQAAVLGCSPPEYLGRRHRELCLSSSSSLAGSRRQGSKLPCNRFVIVSSLTSPRKRGGPESFLFLAPLEGALLPPDLPPIVGTLKGPSSTGGSRRLNVPRRHSSSVLPPRLGKPRRPGELPLRSASSRAGSRRQPAAGRGLFSFVVAAFSRLAPKGAAERACSSSLSAEAEASFGTRPPWLPTTRAKPGLLLCHVRASQGGRRPEGLLEGGRRPKGLLTAGRCNKLHLTAGFGRVSRLFRPKPAVSRCKPALSSPKPAVSRCKPAPSGQSRLLSRCKPASFSQSRLLSRCKPASFGQSRLLFRQRRRTEA